MNVVSEIIEQSFKDRSSLRNLKNVLLLLFKLQPNLIHDITTEVTKRIEKTEMIRSVGRDDVLR